jgi:DNA-binding NtrC family response regulator
LSLNSSILLSNDEKVISVCTDCCNSLNIPIMVKNEFTGLILELQENDYAIVLCDCGDNNKKCFNWIKVIKKLRPKVLLIVISQEIDKTTGGKFYQEGIFNLCKKPLNKNYLMEVLSTTKTSLSSQNSINKFK